MRCVVSVCVVSPPPLRPSGLAVVQVHRPDELGDMYGDKLYWPNLCGCVRMWALGYVWGGGGIGVGVPVYVCTRSLYIVRAISSIHS